MGETQIGLLMISFLGATGVYLALLSQRRTAAQVLADLDDEGSGRISTELKSPGTAAKNGGVDVAEVLLPFAVASLAIGSRLVVGPAAISSLAPLALAGFGLGYLVARRRKFSAKEEQIRQLEFFLPIVMERLVMAVQAGLDVLAAIHAVITLEAGDSTDAAKLDPVTKLLAQVLKLTESGLTFDQALNEVAGSVDCSAVRHAFIHLGVAHQEGGELVMPLKELSDSTQLYFQESIDEQIAKLPVKATMPLLCTFAGLIVCFITSPVIQIMTITASAKGGLG